MEQHHTIAAVAEKLGLSYQTVRKLCMTGAIPFRKFGDASNAPVRIAQSAIDKYLADASTTVIL